MDELKNKDLEKAAGGANANQPHCPYCQSTDIQLIPARDIGELPDYRCNACGKTWGMPL